MAGGLVDERRGFRWVEEVVRRAQTLCGLGAPSKRNRCRWMMRKRCRTARGGQDLSSSDDRMATARLPTRLHRSFPGSHTSLSLQHAAPKQTRHSHIWVVESYVWTYLCEFDTCVYVHRLDSTAHALDRAWKAQFFCNFMVEVPVKASLDRAE